MRYWDVEITDATGAVVKHWSSLTKTGQNDPGALKITFDVYVLSGEVASGSTLFNIHGVDITDLLDANRLNGNDITVRAGMTAGLPLANPSQAGVIFKGSIFQSVGNWVGTDMSISFELKPTIYTIDNPGNFTLHWKQGQTLRDALTQCFNTALPGLPQEIEISADIVSPATQVFVAPSLELLAQQIYHYTAVYFPDLSKFYRGVHIAINKGIIHVWDGTQQHASTQIAFTDLIGQPTWFQRDQLEFITPVRADLSVSNVVKMPQGIASYPGFVQTQTSAFPSNAHYRSTFDGYFQIKNVRHLGDSRSPSAQEWCSVFVGIPYDG